MKIRLVSCSILQKKNKYLVSKRPSHKTFAEYWEFPGGKLERNENFYDAIIRELYEELGIVVQIKDLNIIDNVTHSYKKNEVIIMAVFLLKKWTGAIKARESQTIKWVSKSEINKLNFLEGSKIILERVKSNFYA